MKATKKFTAACGKEIEILADHYSTNCGNFNGVCVSACLSYLGITPDQYKFTWSQRTGNGAALSIMRRFGYSVRSRKSVFKKAATVGALRKLIENHKDEVENVVYYIHVEEHVLLLNSLGETIVDTDPRLKDKRKVKAIEAIFKNPTRAANNR